MSNKIIKIDKSVTVNGIDTTFDNYISLYSKVAVDALLAGYAQILAPTSIVITKNTGTNIQLLHQHRISYYLVSLTLMRLW